MMLNGSQILVQALIDQGVDTIFGYPGGSVLNIYDALYDKRDELHHVLTSHEQGAAHAVPEKPAFVWQPAVRARPIW